jgi:hypothetical protein
MSAMPSRLRLAALLALLAVAAPARADPIAWSYNWSSNPGPIHAQSGPGQVWILPTSGNSQSIKDIVAAQLKTVGTLSPTDKATFNAPYLLTLAITDGPSGKTGTLTFRGTLGGWFTAGEASLTNQFSKPLQQQLTLGKDTYSVTIGAFAPPGAPSSGVFGRIGADVIVSGPTQAPEPGTLILAGLGAAGLAARRWWQKRRGTTLAQQPQAV